ncbi:hypothetical protein LJR143_001580 [Pseudoxanthomonas sp. LjRoot143]|uniref:hypothetical protein n=1 Tax=Pseudoxanthomonas sp. LjRoot143 TaxID=3342266 RepID=UPI000DB71BBC|nr:MAG: hypothetical protein DI562_00070 [Stenotrophomonas acidaminiphila]
MTPQTLDDLGLPGAVYLWSLLHAQQHRLALAPTADLAVEALQVLAAHQVLVLSAPGPQPGFYVTPMEGIGWRWIWSPYPPEGALPALEDYLASVPREELVLELGVALWQRLVRDEAQAFYAQQLARCQFDAHWQQDIAFAQRLSGLSLSASQWRYCAWAAVRQGATLACQGSMASSLVREGMYQELLRRAAALACGRYGRCGFTPSPPHPPTALAQGLACQWFELGQAYWTDLPSTVALQDAGRRSASCR